MPSAMDSGSVLSPTVNAPSLPLIEVKDLRVTFNLEEREAHAVRDVSFTIPQGKTVGLVGESGCGKSMTGLSLLKLIPVPGRISHGQILYYSSDVTLPPTDLVALPQNGETIRSIRGAQIAMIFQEPMSALTPVYTIGQQIGEMVMLHRKMNKADARHVSIEMLTRVGIPAPEQRVNEYPHQLSGGMRQRAVIAMALSCNPRMLIADEPTTALDVTVQAQILDLMRELQQELGMSILIVSHDLGVIADLAEEMIVMYAGRVVEQGTAEQLFYSPQHPYTQGLLRSAPVLGSKHSGKLYSIPGTVPRLTSTAQGCPFRPRCPEAFDKCAELPPLFVKSDGQSVRCWARIETLQ